MNAPDPPFDPGLQAERTLLAWRRTALALAVVSAAGIRFTAPLLGWGAAAFGAAGISLSMAVYYATGVRYRQVHRTLSDSGRHPANGWPPTGFAAAAFLLGFVALTYVLGVQK